MQLNKFFKRYYFYLTIIFILVYIFYNPPSVWTSPHEKSLEQLEKAFIDWHYKYNPTLATKHNLNSYNNDLERYDLVAIEEYNADLNRFIIELSQIDDTKLDDIYLEKYLILEDFLNKNNYVNNNFKQYYYNPAISIENIYNSLFFILYSRTMSPEDKYNALLSRLELIPDCIYNIEKNLIYYSPDDIKKTIFIIEKFEYLLNNLLIEDSLLKPVSKSMISNMSIHLKEVEKSLTKLKKYIQNNIKSKARFNKRDLVNQYIVYDKNMMFEIEYARLINKINYEMLDISLPLYNIIELVCLAAFTQS